MTRRTLLIVAALALTGAGGYWLGVRQSQAPLAGVATSGAPGPASFPAFPPAGIDADAHLDAPSIEALDDPKPALKKALAVTDERARRQQLARIGWAWGRTSPEDAWQQTASVADATARFQLRSAVISAWAGEEPERAFAEVAAMNSGWEREQLLRQVTTELVKRDPRQALQLLTTVELSDTNALHALVAAEWSQFDPGGAGQWIETLELRQQARLAYTIAGAYVAQQPAEALAWALRISRSPGRNLWSHMVGLLATQSPDEALRIARSAESPAQRNQALGAVLRTIAAKDPALAISYLDDIPAGPQRTHTSVQIALQMAETSPELALDWIGGLQDRQARSQGLVELGSRMAWEDVEAAALLIERVPDDMREWWITNVARSYVAQDIDKGIQWVRRFENEPGYASIVRQFASELAARSPDAALELVEHTVDEAQRDQMLSNMVTSGAARQSPETAARWVSRISDDNLRASTVEQLARLWGQYDLAGARRWVLSQQMGQARDRGLAQLAINYTASADSALALIDQIQSREQRMQAVMQTAVRLNWTDPDESRTLLRREPLDPQYQRQLENMLQEQESARRR